MHSDKKYCDPRGDNTMFIDNNYIEYTSSVETLLSLDGNKIFQLDCILTSKLLLLWKNGKNTFQYALFTTKQHIGKKRKY